MRLIAILAFIMMVPFLAHAADEAKPISIAVVDIQQLMGGSKAAKSIQEQGKDLRVKYQKQIGKLEDDLKKAEAKVIEAGKEKDQEKFIKSRKDFQKELVESQKQLAELNQKLDKAVGEALNKLRDEIVDIVGEMATDKGYDLVISRADVVIVAKHIDITAEVMKKLNDSLSSVKVKG